MLIDFVFLAACFDMLPYGVKSAMFFLVRKCALPMALFAVVMFVGVLPKGSALRNKLSAVRAELSIAACILAIGHIAFYLPSFAPRVFAGANLMGNVAASLTLALVVTILMVVLGVTSFRAIKSRMNAKLWKKVQRWAYAFFILALCHAIVALLPAAMRGGAPAIESVVVYGILLVLYVALRLIRYGIDRKED